MNLYWAIVIIYFLGGATGAVLTWAWCKDVRTENKRLRAREGEKDEGKN